jgi:mannose-6-phosphate isomerase
MTVRARRAEPAKARHGKGESATTTSSAAAELAAEVAALKAWMIGDALPFWSTRGFDRSSRLFEERLDFSGRPILEAPRRLMVQCRQLYVFSHAALLGWFEARDLVEQGFAALIEAYGNRVAGAPYVFSVTRAGVVADARQDTYAYAFLLFAFAWTRRLIGPRIDGELPTALLAHLQRELTHASGHGFVDGLPRPDAHLRQNPQMHLFEAALALEDAFGETDHKLAHEARELGHRLFRLFRDKLLGRETRAVPELHDDRWTPLDTGTAFEPGHHFEWIWLLDRYAARSGAEVDDLVEVLAERAFASGIDRDGAAIEAVGTKAHQSLESRRCWATCEALKAAASRFASGRGPPDIAIAQAGRSLKALRSLFLAGPFAGGWIDRVDANGKPLLDHVPASTLYHLFLALAEVDRGFGRSLPSPASGRRNARSSRPQERG